MNLGFLKYCAIFVLFVFFLLLCFSFLLCVCMHHHSFASSSCFIHKKIVNKKNDINVKIYFLFGECVGRMSTKKTIVHFSVSTPDIKKLKIIKEKLPSSAFDRFEIRYGNILDLLRVRVQEEAITALVQSITRGNNADQFIIVIKKY